MLASCIELKPNEAKTFKGRAYRGLQESKHEIGLPSQIKAANCLALRRQLQHISNVLPSQNKAADCLALRRQSENTLPSLQAAQIVHMPQVAMSIFKHSERWPFWPTLHTRPDF